LGLTWPVLERHVRASAPRPLPPLAGAQGRSGRCGPGCAAGPCPAWRSDRHFHLCRPLASLRSFQTGRSARPPLPPGPATAAGRGGGPGRADPAYRAHLPLHKATPLSPQAIAAATAAPAPSPTRGGAPAHRSRQGFWWPWGITGVDSPGRGSGSCTAQGPVPPSTALRELIEELVNITQNQKAPLCNGSMVWSINLTAGVYCAALESLVNVSGCSAIEKTQRMLSGFCPHKVSAGQFSSLHVRDTKIEVAQFVKDLLLHLKKLFREGRFN
uniref:Interleukin-13 n=2 Tax=Pongo abelii TaxID=9601 RepID=A0A8I5TFP5_PONAB